MTNIVAKIVNHKQFTIVWMCTVGAIMSLLGSLEAPAFQKSIISAIPQKMLSLQYFISCGASFIICLIWDKKQPVRQFLMRNYAKFIAICSVFSFAVDGLTLFFVDKEWSIYLLVIGNTIVFDMLFGSWFGRMYSFMKASLFDSTKSRNKLDTKNEAYGCIASMLGFLVGIFFEVSLKTALILSLISTVFWILKHVVTYHMNRPKIIDKVDEPEEEDD